MAFLDVSAMTKDEKAIRAITIPVEAVHWSRKVIDSLGPFCFMLDFEKLKDLDIKYLQVTVDFNNPVIVKKKQENGNVVECEINNVRIGQRGQTGYFISVPESLDSKGSDNVRR